MKYYLVGIKGCAMTALANLLYQKGCEVRGCDVSSDFYTKDKLEKFVVDSIEDIIYDNQYFYIIGNAFKNNDITKRLIDMNINHMNYPEFLSKYFKYHKQLCVAGTHGKTTTSTMLNYMIDDCNFIIGDGSGGSGNSNILILEACEYNNTFLNYNPYISIILNIDYDHPDCFKSIEDYIKSFKSFISKSEYVIVNGDDDSIRKLNKEQLITYGIKNDNDYVFNYKEINNKTIVLIDDDEFELPLLGVHYVYDFVGAYICSKLLNISNIDIKNNMKKFKMPKRRLEEKNVRNTTFICDYAHHPTEIKALYNTIKLKYPNKKIICYFQPHTISRSIAFKKEFKEVLTLFDESYVVNTFSSIREENDYKVEKDLLDYWQVEKIDENQIVNYSFDENKIYAFIGAGDIDKTFNKIL